MMPLAITNDVPKQWKKTYPCLSLFYLLSKERVGCWRCALDKSKEMIFMRFSMRFSGTTENKKESFWHRRTNPAGKRTKNRFFTWRTCRRTCHDENNDRCVKNKIRVIIKNLSLLTPLKKALYSALKVIHNYMPSKINTRAKYSGLQVVFWIPQFVFCCFGVVSDSTRALRPRTSETILKTKYETSELKYNF